MNVVAIIQARMDSTRLPGKVLMNLEGKPLLQHIIESLQQSSEINHIVVATSNETTDDQIEDLVRRLNVNIFRGSRENVLERFYLCSKSFSADLVVRITGDNPLIDPQIVDEVIKISKETNCDYASNIVHQTFPLGFSHCEVIPFRILKYLHETFQNDPDSREHVTIQIRRNLENFSFKEIKAPPSLERSKWRLTIDFIEDLQLMEKIFSKLSLNNSVIDYRSLVNFLDHNENLLQINQNYTNSFEI